MLASMFFPTSHPLIILSFDAIQSGLPIASINKPKINELSKVRRKET
jgi:hypothetical protein